MPIAQAISAAITTIFLLIILSYYALLFWKKKKPEPERKFSSITVILPAHNEEKYIAQSIQSVIDAKFEGAKEIIVVDDGSLDRTKEIAHGFPEVTVISTKHTGKSDSLNSALKKSKGELIAVVDADSVIEKDALEKMAQELGRNNIAAASGVVKVNNRKGIGMWLHLELVYNSLIRSILAKANANVVTPGALSVFRKDALNEVGGFSTDGFLEDVDITIKLIRKGYHAGFVEDAISRTNMPLDPKGFLKQRTRWIRGMISILKKLQNI